MPSDSDDEDSVKCIFNKDVFQYEFEPVYFRANSPVHLPKSHLHVKRLQSAYHRVIEPSIKQTHSRIDQDILRIEQVLVHTGKQIQQEMATSKALVRFQKDLLRQEEAVKETIQTVVEEIVGKLQNFIILDMANKNLNLNYFVPFPRADLDSRMAQVLEIANFDENVFSAGLEKVGAYANK